MNRRQMIAGTVGAAAVGLATATPASARSSDRVEMVKAVGPIKEKVGTIYYQGRPYHHYSYVVELEIRGVRDGQEVHFTHSDFDLVMFGNRVPSAEEFQAVYGVPSELEAGIDNYWTWWDSVYALNRRRLVDTQTFSFPPRSFA